MSQEFNDPEIFADFIIESKEHLETIEPNLLELEKAPGNLSLLNEIFRPMHSLKGASGFLGLNRINTLAHRAENVLDELRKGSMSVTSEIMDVILSSTDALRQMIENLEKSATEGDVEIQPITDVLDAIMAGGMPSSAPKAAPVPPAEVALPEPAVPSGVAVPPSDAPVSIGAEVDVSEWLDGLKQVEPYTLTAFGADHLKDFIEEARENLASISDGLLHLEKETGAHDAVVNDMFRYFHNIKGNSGIIGYQEMNGLTHEAETLLNLVRKDEMKVTPPLVDILLLVVDVLEKLLARIDLSSGQAKPFESIELLEKLRQATGGGLIELPASLKASVNKAKAPVAAGEATAVAVPEPAGVDASDLSTFKDTTKQQNDIITAALAGLSKNGEDKLLVDALYRGLVTVQNSANYMGFGELKVYAERTAGIVDQGRKTGLDFSVMVDLLTQECGIIADMVQNAIQKVGASASAVKPAVPASSTSASKPAVQAAESKAVPSTGVPTVDKPAVPARASAVKPATLASSASASKPDVQAAESKVASSTGTHEVKAAAPASSAAAAKPVATAAGKDESTSKASSTIRVDHEKLDHLMNLIGELIINRNRYTMLARNLENNTNVDIVKVAQDLSETTYAMARISDDLQDTIMKVRMVPVASVFSRFPRLVRDLSRKSGKEVELILEGEETELDKSVVEVIGDPLVHLIRNSVDHGIEAEDGRVAAGKESKGKVWLRAYHKGNSVAIEIEDDGKGIDPEKMREVAVRKGVTTAEEARLMDDREAIELIFAPGFSAAEKVTDISGRGVGMDVVRTNIKSLKGTIATQSTVGKGTRFTLSLPLTLAIIDALMVNVDKYMYAIPLDAVSETTKIEASRMTDVKGRKAVTLRGEVLGIVSLSELLGLPCNVDKRDDEVLSVVVIHDNERRLGLVVDRLLERQEIVIKPLGSYLGDIKGISGATIMGDGSVILIMDPHELYLMATSKAM